MINQEFKAKEENIKCCLILESVSGSRKGGGLAQSYEFSRMRAQILLCRTDLECTID